MYQVREGFHPINIRLTVVFHFQTTQQVQIYAQVITRLLYLMPTDATIILLSKFCQDRHIPMQL